MPILKAFTNTICKEVTQPVLDPVSVLEQRREFMEGIKEVAYACNWSSQEIEQLNFCVWEDLVEMDNVMLDTYNQTDDLTLAKKRWENKMENLRRWLSMMFGIKIKYV